jgi:mRNA interferase MazF
VGAVSGDSGRPQPALVVRSEFFYGLPPVTICPMSGTSQILIDRMTTVPLAKVGKVIGYAEHELMVRVNRALALFLGIS